MAEGDAGNLKIQQEINNVLQARTALLASNQKALSGQVATAIQLCKALKCEELDKIAEQMGEIDNATAKAAKAAKDYGQAATTASAAALASHKAEQKEIEKKNALLNVGKAIGVGAFAGLASGIAGSINMLKGLGKGLAGIIGTIGKVSQTILMIPFKVMGGLIGMAQSGGGGGPSPIRLELEAIRKVYGDLASNEGKALASVQQSVQKSSKNLAGTGLTLGKVFGRGRKGVAEAMKQAGEIAKSLGPAFNSLTEEFSKNAVQLTMLTRGFTGSAEATAAMMRHAKALGKDGTNYITEIAGAAQTMGEKFGVSAKVIGKGMGEMMKNISDFGHMAKKEMLAATTYAAKLGLEIKDLGGVMNKFLNFEDAAEGAAQMAQAFGMNIDAMELMKGGPEAIDEMRRAFFESGKALEDMSAAERKMLETQTGLTGAALESAFSAESQGTNYKDMSKGADDAEKQAKSQAEVMNKLADSIDRVFGSGGGKKFKSFFDAFVQGFQSGIMKTQEMRKLMKNLRKSLREVFKGGREVGKMFVKMFPGVKDMLKGMGDLFDPKRIRKLMKEITKVFGSFFKDLETNPDTAVTKFFERMTAAFKKWFSGSGPAAGQIKKGGAKFLKALGAIFKGLLTHALIGLTKLFKGIAEAIRNPPEVKSALGTAFAEFGKSIWELLKMLGPPLADAFGEMISAAFDRLKGSKHIQKAMKILKGVLLTKIFLTAALGAAKAAASMIMVNVIGPWLKKLVMGAKKIPAGGGDAPTPGDEKSIKTLSKTGDAISGDKTDWKQAMKKGALMVVFIAVTIVALAGAFWVAAQIIKTISMEDIIKTGAFMLVTAVTILMVAAAARMNKGVKTSDVITELAAMVLIIPAIGAVGIVVGWLISQTKLPSVGEALKWGLMMSMALFATGLCVMMAGQVDKIVKVSGGPVNVLIGLGILGLIMIALGGIGVAIGWMLSSIPDPGAVSKIMFALAAIMLVTMLMLPVAGLLGLMLMSFPFGTAGIGILLMGFGVLGSLAVAMVGSLMPAIKTIAGLKIENPAHFKMVTEAIVAIINGISSFAVAVARIMEAIDPGISASISGSKSEELQKSINSVAKLIDAIMVPMQSIIDKMIDLAQSADIEKEGVEAIKAIAAVIGAIGGLMKAFSPSDAAFKAAEEAQGFWNPNGAANLMTAVQDGMAKTMKAASGMIKAVGAMVVDIAASVGNTDFSAVGPLLTAIPGILGAIAGIMKALSPSDKQMEAVQEAAGTWGGDEVGLMESMRKNMVAGIKAARPLIKMIGKQMGEMISGPLTTMIEKVGQLDVNPDVLGAIATIIAALMEGIGKMIAVIGPAMESMQKSTEKNWLWGPSEADQMSSQMGDFGLMMGQMGGMFEQILPAVETFVKSVVELAQTIDNPEKAAAGMGVIGQAVKTLGDVTGPMIKAMDMIMKYKSGSWQSELDWYFGEDGLLDLMVLASARGIGKFMKALQPVMTAMGDPKKAAAQLAVITSGVTALGNVTGPMIKSMDMIMKYKSGSWQSELDWYFGEGGLLDLMVDSVGRGIAKFMTAILAIKIPNPEAAKTKMEVISSGLASASTLLKMVGDGMKMIVKHKSGSWQSELNWYFGKNGLVVQMADSLGTGLAIVITKIMDTVKGIADPEKAKKQVALVAQILEAVSTFVGVVNTVSQMKVKGSGSGVGAVMELVAGISAQLAHSMPEVINGVLGAIEGSDPGKVSKLWKYRHSIKILGSLMCAVGQFAGAISTMQALGGSAGKTNAILQNMALLFGEGGWARQALINIVDGVGELNLGKIGKAQVTGMKAIATFICEVSNFVTAVTGMTWDASFYDKVKVLSMGLDGKGGSYGPIAAAQNLIKAITDKNGGFQANSGNIHVQTIQKLATFLSEGLAPAMTAISAIPEGITSRVTDVKTAVTDLQEISAAISNKEIKAAVQIGEALAGSGHVSLDLTKDLTMNLHVQVNMSAEQIAKGVVTTSAMKKSLGQGA